MVTLYHKDSIISQETVGISQLLISDDFKTDLITNLDIYSLLCFNCGALSECALDPKNLSKTAQNGVKYFHTYEPNKEVIERFADQAKKYENVVVLEKIQRLVRLKDADEGSPQ